MKKVLLFSILCLYTNLIMASVMKPEPKKKIFAADILIPLGETGMKVSLLDISQFNIKEAEMIRGRKMKFSEKIAFKLSQRKLKQLIDRDGSLNDQRMIKNLRKADEKEGFHAGGFFLGLFLGVIGIIIAILTNDAKKPSRVRWATIGCGILIAISVLIIAISV